MQSTIVLSLIAALLAGGVAIAQSNEYNQPHYVAKFDARFRAADTNGDGALTKQEAINGGLDRIAEQFDRIDTDKDGKVTREDLRKFLISRLSS